MWSRTPPGCLSVPFPNNPRRVPVSLECVFIHGAFHSLPVLYSVCLFFNFPAFFSCLAATFPQCLHTKPLHHPRHDPPTGRQNTGSLQYPAGSRVCVCVVKYMHAQGQEFCESDAVRAGSRAISRRALAPRRQRLHAQTSSGSTSPSNLPFEVSFHANAAPACSNVAEDVSHLHLMDSAVLHDD